MLLDRPPRPPALVAVAVAEAAATAPATGGAVSSGAAKILDSASLRACERTHHVWFRTWLSPSICTRWCEEHGSTLEETCYACGH